MTLDALFKKRNAAYLKDLTKYGRIIINDHFVLILFILLGAGGFAYANYLETLAIGMIQPRILLVFLFLLVVSTGSLTLLLEPADTIFLLPKEEAFKKIFKSITLKSYLQSLLSVAITTVVVFPIFVATLEVPPIDMVFIFLTLAGLKWFNFLIKIAPFFEGAKQTERKNKIILHGVKLLIIISLIFLHIRLTTLLVVAVTAYSAYQYFTEKIFFGRLFNWETMLAAEEKRMQRLYRFIGLFTNVPNIETSIKRLPWLDNCLHRLSQKNPTAPYYYILRTVTRNTDYSLLIIRATIVGMILLMVTGSFVLSAGLILLFLYIIGFQLLPLIYDIERAPQFKMYPITAEEKAQAVFKLIFQILFLTSIFLVLATINTLGIYSLIQFPIGFLFAYLFSYFYAPSRLKKNY